MDVEITHWINSFAGESQLIDQVMIGVTDFGVPLIVAFVVLQWWSREDRIHVRHAAICSGLAFLLGLAINQGILLFIHRLRPYDAGVSHLLIVRSADWSFPSDHATVSIAVATAFIIQEIPRRGLVLLLMSALICFSRIYVGTHYLADILGGAAVGVLAAITVHFLYRENSKLDRILTKIL